MEQSIVVHGLIKKRAEIAGLHMAAQKAADTIKDDLAAIDRDLALCGYQDDPKGIAPRGKYGAQCVDVDNPRQVARRFSG